MIDSSVASVCFSTNTPNVGLAVHYNYYKNIRSIDRLIELQSAYAGMGLFVIIGL